MSVFGKKKSSLHLIIYVHAGLFVLCLQESQKKEASQTQRRHERKKEKRKKSARLQLQVPEQSLSQSQTQAGTLTLPDDTDMHPQLVEMPQTEKPQKTTVKTVPKTPKASQHDLLLAVLWP